MKKKTRALFALTGTVGVGVGLAFASPGFTVGWASAIWAVWGTGLGLALAWLGLECVEWDRD